MDSFAFQGTFSKVWRRFWGLSRWRSGKEPACPCRRYKKERVKSLSRVRLFATPYTVAHQAPLSMAFSRQEYWSGLPFPPPEDIPDPGIEPRFSALQADALPLSHQGRYKRHRLLWFRKVVLGECYWPRMLLNILQCIGWPPQQRIIQPLDFNRTLIKKSF